MRDRDGEKQIVRLGLLFLLELADESRDLVLFSGSDASKGDAKRLTFNPADDCLIDHDRPIEIRNVEAAFELFSLTYRCFALDLASSDGQIDRSTAHLLSAPRESASKLRGKARLDSPLNRARQRRFITILWEIENRRALFHCRESHEWLLRSDC